MIYLIISVPYKPFVVKEILLLLWLASGNMIDNLQGGGGENESYLRG